MKECSIGVWSAFDFHGGFAWLAWSLRHVLMPKSPNSVNKMTSFPEPDNDMRLKKIRTTPRKCSWNIVFTAKTQHTQKYNIYVYLLKSIMAAVRQLCVHTAVESAPVLRKADIVAGNDRKTGLCLRSAYATCIRHHEEFALKYPSNFCPLHVGSIVIMLWQFEVSRLAGFQDSFARAFLLTMLRFKCSCGAENFRCLPHWCGWRCKIKTPAPWRWHFLRIWPQMHS